MATTYWQNKHSQALILPTKEGTSITIPQAGYVKDESGTYYSASFGLTSVSEPSGVTYAYTYTHQVPPPDEVGEPGGTTGQLQYNNAGEFAGVAGSTCDESGVFLEIPTEILLQSGAQPTSYSSMSLQPEGYANLYASVPLAEGEGEGTSNYAGITLAAANDTPANITLSATTGLSAPATILLEEGDITCTATELNLNVSGVTFGGNILSRNYVDNAAALADGLVEGQLYHTDGALKVVVPVV